MTLPDRYNYMRLRLQTQRDKGMLEGYRVAIDRANKLGSSFCNLLNVEINNLVAIGRDWDVHTSLDLHECVKKLERELFDADTRKFVQEVLENRCYAETDVHDIYTDWKELSLQLYTCSALWKILIEEGVVEDADDEEFTGLSI